jgi:hypothetical protein
VIPTGAGDGTKAYTVRIGAFAESTGGFKVTTGSCVSVIVSGTPGR